jgi:uncharacterized protein YegL
MEQQPFASAPNPFVTDTATQFAENPENRCACVLVLDVSGSMAGRPVAELQEGLTVYRDSLAADTLARKRVEVAVLTFGGTVEVAHAFTTAEFFTPPSLSTRGDTPMAQAVNAALDMIEARKNEYRTNGVGYYRPWVFLITDGGPTDANTSLWPEAIRRVKEGEETKKFSFFAVGVEGADFERLKELSFRDPLKLKGLAFRSLFQWLSSSQQSVSRSKPGEDVPLSNPTAPNGWAQI